MQHYFGFASTPRQERGERQGVIRDITPSAIMEKSAHGHWFKIGSFALALQARNVVISTKSEEKIYFYEKNYEDKKIECSLYTMGPNWSIGQWFHVFIGLSVYGK